MARFLLLLTALTIFLTSSNISSAVYPLVNDQLRYTLFIDPPIPNINDISTMSAWDPRLKTKVPVEKLKESMAGA
ncbi:MAG: hypothetical protein WCG27_08580, partial [Pseudomonadota bacterium]